MNYDSKVSLEEVTAIHPYFSVAQFHLLKQGDPLSASYDKMAARTAIHFNNPYWLNFQLQDHKHEAQANEETVIIPEHQITSTEITDNNAAEVIAVTEEPMAPVITAQEENTDNDDDATGEDEIVEKEIEPMKLQFNMPQEQFKPDELLFEPMHMVDYFASQGIKLKEEVQPSDKLGKQLKSFTEWLKTMKKITAASGETALQAEKAADPAESSIQTLAEKSNTEQEVLTESMAEVFAKQGKIDKAAELYQKLSLLNPSKSAYFAAKLENLKGL
jgi:hypothetical protein